MTQFTEALAALHEDTPMVEMQATLRLLIETPDPTDWDAALTYDQASLWAVVAANDHLTDEYAVRILSEWTPEAGDISRILEALQNNPPISKAVATAAMARRDEFAAADQYAASTVDYLFRQVFGDSRFM